MTVAEFQSTRPRGARLADVDDLSSLNWVSIHAPTGGATQLNYTDFTSSVVSIHAPTGGATREPRHYLTTVGCFNPRAHGGRDRYHVRQ